MCKLAEQLFVYGKCTYWPSTSKPEVKSHNLLYLENKENLQQSELSSWADEKAKEPRKTKTESNFIVEITLIVARDEVHNIYRHFLQIRFNENHAGYWDDFLVKFYCILTA